MFTNTDLNHAFASLAHMTEAVGLSLSQAITVYVNTRPGASDFAEAWLRGFAFGASSVHQMWQIPAEERVFEGPGPDFNEGVSAAWSLGPDVFDGPIDDMVDAIENLVAASDPHIRVRSERLLPIVKSWRVGMLNYRAASA